MTQVPLLDLAAQHASIRPEIDAAVARVLDHGRFVAGPEVAAFEERFADFCGARHAIGTSSGTDGLTLALRAAGVGRGDEVITSAMTFIATAESIVEAGARPVLVDPEPDTALMGHEQVEAAITDATAAVAVVHLYGQAADMTELHRLAERRGLLLIEDAAQAHGASWRGIRAGALGKMAAFSFFPGKNLGALGDAGAVTTDDDGLAARVRRLRDHGRSDKYRHDVLGVNARLDTLQAAVLGIKLERLEGWNAARRATAETYDQAFADLEHARPLRVRSDAQSVYHWYVLRMTDRDAGASHLAERGVASGIHYPIPLNRQPALEALVPAEGFPEADRLASEVLSLPVHPELSDDQRGAVIDAVREHALDPIAVRGRAA